MNDAANPYSAPIAAPGAPAPASGADPEQLRTVLGPLAARSGWVTALGVLSIVYGAMMALSIWGIVIAWLPIWSGALLLKAATAVREAVDRGDEQRGQEASAALAKAMMLTVIAIGIGVAVGVAFVGVMFAIGFAGALNSHR